MFWIEINVLSENRKENSDCYMPILYVLGPIHDISFNSHNNSQMRVELSIFFKNPERFSNLHKWTQLESNGTEMQTQVCLTTEFLFSPYHCINVVGSLGVSCSWRKMLSLRVIIVYYLHNILCLQETLQTLFISFPYVVIRKPPIETKKQRHVL